MILEDQPRPGAGEAAGRTPAAASTRDLSVHRDAQLLGGEQTRDSVEQRGLARARGAEHPGGPSPEAEVEVEVEAASLDERADLEPAHVWPPPAPRRRRRTTSSLARSAAAERSTDTTVSRRAAPSPPGTWVPWKIARGSVRVSPAMLPARVMVAPNSPRLRAEAER